MLGYNNVEQSLEKKMDQFMMFHIFSRETNSVASLLSLTKPFWKEVYSKRKWSKFFPFRVVLFSEARQQLWQLLLPPPPPHPPSPRLPRRLPLKLYPFT